MNKTVLGSICFGFATATAMASAATPANLPGAHVALMTDETHTRAAQPAPPPQSNVDIEHILFAMGQVETDDHPDLFGEFAGMQRLFDGDDAGAIKYFKIGAHYADKLSQLSIGMMYLHGRGVSKDPAIACAWFKIAAERGYPSFVQVRDLTCAPLTPAQRNQAAMKLTALQAQYGDAVAKPRMAQVLRTTRSSLTASQPGHGRNSSSWSDKNHCHGDALALGGIEIPRRGCGMDNQQALTPDAYFAARDAQWLANVTVGGSSRTSALPATATAPGAEHDR